MKTIILLAMHGSPPRDFPRPEAAEFFRLHAQIEQGAPPGANLKEVEARYAALEARMRAWPRTPENDPFHAASLALGEQLSQITGDTVVVGFNEFCAPTLDEACDMAIAQGADQVIFITPMMTRGGEHAEQDIPQVVKRAEQRHPTKRFRYAWPFEVSDVARFLAEQVEKFRF
jgi:sirohydrochlorin cobaltochelatase